MLVIGIIQVLDIVEPTPQPNGDIVDTGNTVEPKVTGQVATNRAMRYRFALGPTAPSTDELEYNISTGQEHLIQAQAEGIERERLHSERGRRIIEEAQRARTPEEARRAALAYLQPVEIDVNTLLQKRFGDRYASMILNNNRDNPIVRTAINENPEQTKQIVTGTAYVAAMREVARNIAEETHNKISGMGWGSYLWNLGKSLIPGVSATTLSPNWNPLNIAFTGSSLFEERQKFWSFQDLGQARAWLKSRVDQIAASNPLDAATFAEAMVSLPSDAMLAHNFFSSSDVSGVGGAAVALGKAGVAGAASAVAMRRLMRDSLDGITPDGALKMDIVHAASGDLKKAAEVRVTRDILSRDKGLNVTPDLSEKLWTLNDPNAIWNLNPGALVRERAEAVKGIIQQMQENSNKLMDALVKGARAQRIPEEAIQKLLDEAADLIRLQRPSINDSVLDIRMVYDRATNTRHAEVVIGKRDGTLFRSAAQADNYAQREYGLDFRGFRVATDPDMKDISGIANIARDVANTLVKKVNYVSGDRRGNRIEGFNSIQGFVKLTDGTELKVTNSKRGIFTFGGDKSKVDPKDIVAFKTSAKNAEWKDVTDAKPVTEPSQNQKRLDAAFKQQGGYWYISITKPLNETGELARSLQLATNNTNPVNVGNWFLGGLLRSAEDQLAYFQRSNRHLVTHVPQEVQRVMVDMAQSIGKLKKSSHEALEKVLIANRDYTDGPTQIRGKAYRRQSDLEKAWLDANNILPNAQESLAYWSYHQLMDIDWVMRNYGVHRDLARQGIETYSFKVPGLNGDIEVTFNGRFEKSLPTKSTEDFSILVADGDNRKVLWWSKLNEDERKVLVDLVENGMQVLKVANPADRPLMDQLGIKSTVNFVLTKEHNTAPLKMNIVDYNPGVHVMYPQEYFVKQPMVVQGEFGRYHYYGDKTLFAVDTEAEAKRLGEAVSKVQRMIADKATDDELNAFITRNLPEDAAYWRKVFNDHLTMDQPIGYTHTGKTFFDTHTKYLEQDIYKNMVNERASSHNLYRSIDMDYMANRDFPGKTVTNTDSPEKPIYTLEKARVLDPFVSLNRALGNSIRTLYLNDYKIGAIEQWVQQYANLMKNPARALDNPFQYFYNPNWNEAVSDRMLRASADNTRERILQFLGARSELGRDINYAQQKLMNSLGENKARWYADHELWALKDPVAFTRSWMFDFKFGFFNPKQYIVQAQGFTHIYGVAGPTAAWRGTSAYILQRAMFMNENPEILNRMANIATKFGWKKEHFIESYQTMRNIGFDIVGKEHALRDGAFDPNLWDTSAGRVLEWGRKPFIEGERSVRIGAWNVAYYEWRKVNPTKELTEFDIGKILTRADDLSLNMTKASHAGIQEGLWAIPSQFYTFSHRIMEQFWGGRLTPTEKARAFATHSMLYGIPVAAGAAYPWPFYDSLRADLLAKGSDLTDNSWHKLATDGFLAYVGYHLTGTEYNTGQRYGPGFSDTIKKFFDNELSFLEAIGGATGGFLNSMTKATYPFVAHGYIALTGQQESFPLVKEDILGLLREISSVNDAYNAWMAVNTGKYFSRNDNFVAEGMTGKDAAAIMMGLTRRDITDARLLISTLKDQRENQRRIQDLAVRELKRGIQYAADNDWNKFETHMARAKAMMVVFGDLRDEQIAEAWKKATTEREALVSRIRHQFTQQGYKSQLPARLQRLFEQ